MKETESRMIYSVTQLNGYIKQRMDADPVLQGVFVRGEVSNYKLYPSGHAYFSLKDESAALRCVMFKREASALRFVPQNGMKVIAIGRVAVFPRDGAYQLYCNELSPDGVGDLHAAFEQLKQKLYTEGLFDERNKKPLPKYPARIALITSPAGAAVRDMIRVLGQRWPMAQVLVLPVRVQGEEAPGEISRAITFANEHNAADLIITGRGGGSMEDLWAFNEEIVVRAIFGSRIPVISAVGHEPDVTISDFVADLRAATPSNAAELAVPDCGETAVYLDQLRLRLCQSLGRRVEAARTNLARLRQSRVMADPVNYLADRRAALELLRKSMEAALERRTAREGQRFAGLAAKLDALSPLKVLGRGYAIARLEGGAVLVQAAQAAPGARFSLRVSDGEVPCVVREE